MVSVKLVGRLGNQAFEHAAGIAHAARHGYEYVPPPATEHEGIWPYYFEHLRSDADMRPLTVYNEPSFSYNPIPAIDNIRLNGFFQSAAYFDDYRELVLDTLQLKPTEQIDAIAIHVRRGDYLQYKEKHPVLPMSYYHQAIEFFPGEKFLVFTDDYKWCFDNIVRRGVKVVIPENPMKDLLKMASCKQVITANSSYSWWAAYVNGNTPVMPKQWFGAGNKHLDTSDLYIPEAIII